MADAVFTGEIVSGAPVTVRGLGEGVVVGPDDVLVITAPYASLSDVMQHRDLIEKVLPADRYLILAGDWSLFKVSNVDAAKLRDAQKRLGR